MTTRTYLTEDARQQEAACQRPGEWLVEGYTLWYDGRYWLIADGDDQPVGHSFRTLAEARNWLADYLAGAER
jgi:hypothetical protein